MKKRKLHDLEVSAIGLGCMGFSHGYGAIPPEEESIRLIRYAHDLGCTLFDTAEVYGPFVNEELTGKAVKPFRKDIILSTKIMPVQLPGQKPVEEKLSFAGIEATLEASLQRLQTDYVDLYYLHRVPDSCPLEDIAESMGKLIKTGKIRSWGLSQADGAQIIAANNVTQLSAIQNEYSMMERMYEKDAIPACAKLDIGFVPFSPLAGGFLSGKYDNNSHYEGDDVRRVITRYKPENVAANQPLLDLLHKFAEEKHATPAQISLAWMLKKAPFIVPIPGMRSEARIRENLGAADIELTDAEFEALEKALSGIKIYGNRTDADIAKLGTVQTK
ncbi:MAG: aldo/keto reductase [Desulfovibrio sp.]|nr:aldo/keto reductase [Desulfovibrio sp.]